MENKNQIIRNTFKNKGLLEIFYCSCSLALNKGLSIIKITLLRLRGYRVDYSVVLGGDNTFFQTNKHAISIGKNSRLGKHTRVSAGFSGKIAIDKNVLLDDSSYIMAQGKISIGENTIIAAFCYIVDFNHNYNDLKTPIVQQGYAFLPITIEENVWIGTHVVILPGVTIGKGSVIGAGSIVTKSIKPYSIAVGNPAKVIKQRA